MYAACWTLTDEERSIEYKTVLHYEIDEGVILICNVDLLSVTDWFYNPKIGADTKYPEEENVVCKWILEQIHNSEPVRQSAEEACRLDCEEHLEILLEQSQGVI